MKSKRIHVTIDEGTLKKIDKMARKYHQSRSGFIKLITAVIAEKIKIK